MTDAIHEALAVKGEDEADGAEPEKRLPANEQAAEVSQAEHGELHALPKGVGGRGEVLAETLLGGLTGLPEPPQMRPPEATDRGARDVLLGVCGRVMETVVGCLRRGRA